MKVKAPGQRRPAVKVDHKILKTRDWWLSVVRDPKFWDVINLVKTRCSQTAGVKDSPHAQSYAGGYRDAWSEFPDELVKIATEQSEEDIPVTSSYDDLKMAQDADLLN
jgi:hypothetical protein